MIGRCPACPSKDEHIAAQASSIKFLEGRVAVLEDRLSEIAGARATLPRGADPKPMPRSTNPGMVPWSQGLVADGHADGVAETKKALERAHPRAAMGPTATGEPTA